MKSFKLHRLDESRLDTIVSKWQQVGVDLYVFESPEYIKIMALGVPKGERKQGTGSEVMESLIQYADSVGKMVVLTPGMKDDHHGTTSRSRLKKFYKRFGFVENKGRNKEFTINAGDMYRKSKGE